MQRWQCLIHIHNGTLRCSVSARMNWINYYSILVSIQKLLANFSVAKKSRNNLNYTLVNSAQDPDPDPLERSARFWLFESGSVKIFVSIKIFESTDPDPRGKTLTKHCKKKYFQTPNLNNKNREKNRDYKNFLISEWFIKFQHKNKGTK